MSLAQMTRPVALIDVPQASGGSAGIMGKSRLCQTADSRNGNLVLLEPRLRQQGDRPAAHRRHTTACNRVSGLIREPVGCHVCASANS